MTPAHSEHLAVLEQSSSKFHAVLTLIGCANCHFRFMFIPPRAPSPRPFSRLPAPSFPRSFQLDGKDGRAQVGGCS